MKKNIFGFMLSVIILGILSINVFQNVREKKEELVTREGYLTQSESKEDYKDTFREGLLSGDIPPNFELKTLDGITIRLSDYKGKKVILNFWASWCPPCKAEMPHLENYYKTKAKSQNVEIIAVNLTNFERGPDRHGKVKSFIEDNNLTFLIPLDEDGKAGKNYQIIAIPTSYMIDSNGLIHKKITGPLDKEMLEKLVKEMN